MTGPIYVSLRPLERQSRTPSQDRMTAVGKRPVHKLSLIFCGAFVLLASFGLRFWLLHERGFDPDEFEHLHAAWYLSKGFVPFRDFFENHTPVLHFVLAPIVGLFDVESDVHDAFAAIFLARKVMLVFTALIVIFTLWLGWFCREWCVGLFAAVFLSNSVMFLEKSLEVRPDSISVFAWIAGLVSVAYAFRSKTQSGLRTRVTFLICGVFLGLGFMASQKIAFAMIGFCIVMLWYLFDGRFRGTFASRFFNALIQFFGFCLPIFLVLGYLEINGAVEDFIKYAFLFNSGWPREFWHWRVSADLVAHNPVLAGLGAIGLFRAIFRYTYGARFDSRGIVLTVTLLGLLLGLFIIPAPYPQYYMMLMPLLAIFAAMTLVDVVDALVVRAGEERVGIRSIGQEGYLPFVTRENVLACLLILISIAPAIWMRHQFKWSNAQDLAEIAYVMEHTTASDTVMDGWKGVGVFRPHALFFWMLPPTLAQRIPLEDRDKILRGLESGEIAPRIVNMDSYLLQLGPETSNFLEKHYRPVGLGDLYIRND